MGVSGRGRGRSATALIFIALFALLAGAIVGVAFRKVLVVKSVEIVGLEGEEADAVRALAGIRLGQSILDVDSREISINMRENGYIKLCGVEVVKPDKVVITVSRRERAAAFEHLGFTYIVDAELSVLECTGGLSDAGVMIITGAAVQHTPVGMPINIDAGKGAMIKQLLCAIEEAGLTSSISELNVANAQSIYMVKPGGEAPLGAPDGGAPGERGPRVGHGGREQRERRRLHAAPGHAHRLALALRPCHLPAV